MMVSDIDYVTSTTSTTTPEMTSTTSTTSTTMTSPTNTTLKHRNDKRNLEAFEDPTGLENQKFLENISVENVAASLHCV